MNHESAETATAGEDRRFLSIEEVAEYLNVSPATVRTWRANKSGPRGIRVGKHVRYRSSDVELWLELRSDPPPRW